MINVNIDINFFLTFYIGTTNITGIINSLFINYTIIIPEKFVRFSIYFDNELYRFIFYNFKLIKGSVTGMRLSTKSRYGLRILLQIAMDSVDGSAVKGNVIAKKQEISEPYLEQIMIPLKRAGYINTIRGCNGGYILNIKPGKVSVLDVIELFEGRVNLVDCTNGKKKCSRNSICPMLDIWKHLSDSFRTEAGNISLASILKKMNKNN